MIRRPHWNAIAVVASVLILSACTPADGNPPEPATSSVALSPLPEASTSSTPPTIPPPAPGTTPVAATDQTWPTQPDEINVWIPAGDHRVPGTLAMPTLKPGEKAPAVLLLHGDLGDRDSGGMFVRLADSLAARGIASLRIDFAGSGESEEPDLSLDYPGMVLDATASLTYLQQDALLDADRLAILGFSRGGSIAATVAGTVPGVAALVSWSGAIANGYEEDPDAHQEARENGEVVIDLGDQYFQLSLAWYDTILESHPLDDVAGYTEPVLAVVGSDDQVVDPAISDEFLATVASTDKTLHVIDGADHGFTAEQEYADEAIAVTTDWLASRLAAQ